MSTDSKEFFDLLNSISNEQTFELQLSPKQDPGSVTCRHLTTMQLKELIKSAVDSPITQSVFNSTVTKVFKQSLTSDSSHSFNVVDRLLFIINTRINSLSPTLTITGEEDKKVNVNFEEVKSNLYSVIGNNINLFEPQSATDGKVALTFGIPLLDTEQQLNEEIYKNLDPKVDTSDELRSLLGEAFINEIAKCLQKISIQDKELDLSKVSFKSRLKAIESLSAGLIQKVIEFVETYKRVLDEPLRVEGVAIPIDSTLFAVR